MVQKYNGIEVQKVKNMLRCYCFLSLIHERLGYVVWQLEKSKNTDVLDNGSKCQKTTGLLRVKLKISD